MRGVALFIFFFLSSGAFRTGWASGHGKTEHFDLTLCRRLNNISWSRVFVHRQQRAGVIGGDVVEPRQRSVREAVFRGNGEGGKGGGGGGLH